MITTAGITREREERDLYWESRVRYNRKTEMSTKKVTIQKLMLYKVKRSVLQPTALLDLKRSGIKVDERWTFINDILPYYTL